MSFLRDSKGYIDGVKTTIFVTLLLVILIATLMAILPRYSVWSQEMRGKAELARAEQNKQILIAEANARLEAEKLNALSEIERAKGMAQAMEIEQGQLTSTYNQYLFIRQLEKLAEMGTIPTIIYLPSEGMLPVMDLKKDIKK